MQALSLTHRNHPDVSEQGDLGERGGLVFSKVQVFGPLVTTPPVVIIGLSPLEKGLKRGSSGLAPCRGLFGRAGKKG